MRTAIGAFFALLFFAALLAGFVDLLKREDIGWIKKLVWLIVFLATFGVASAVYFFVRAARGDEAV